MGFLAPYPDDHSRNKHCNGDEPEIGADPAADIYLEVEYWQFVELEPKPDRLTGYQVS